MLEVELTPGSYRWTTELPYTETSTRQHTHLCPLGGIRTRNWMATATGLGVLYLKTKYRVRISPRSVCPTHPVFIYLILLIIEVSRSYSDTQIQ
jgi:hypothetical protein